METKKKYGSRDLPIMWLRSLLRNQVNRQKEQRQDAERAIDRPILGGHPDEVKPEPALGQLEEQRRGDAADEGRLPFDAQGRRVAVEQRHARRGGADRQEARGPVGVEHARRVNERDGGDEGGERHAGVEVEEALDVAALALAVPDAVPDRLDRQE